MNEPIARLHVASRFSDTALFNGVAYLAGQVPESTVEQGIREQTAEVLSIIDRLLGEAGSDKSRILMCQIFLKDIGEIGAMNEVWDRWVVAGQTPPRATVQAALADPRWRVEIVVTAARA